MSTLGYANYVYSSRQVDHEKVCFYLNLTVFIDYFFKGLSANINYNFTMNCAFPNAGICSMSKPIYSFVKNNFRIWMHPNIVF